MLALAALPLTLTQAGRAFPIVDINLEMSREEALGEARRLEKMHHFGPRNFEQAASFFGGDEVETYLEHEGGGSEAFQRLLRSGDYYPYTWSVRHFVPEEWAETEFEFTPDGKLWGYWITLDEEPGPALDLKQARAVAEQQASSFGLDLSKYRLQNNESWGGPDENIRRDWELEYVRSDPRIEKATFNVTAYVNGDQFGGFTQSIELPRSYEIAQSEVDETRVVILGIVGFVAGSVFFVGGAFALTVLARRRQFEWRRSVGWGAALALIAAAAELNSLPVYWFDYSTFGSKATFVGEQISYAATTFFSDWAMASVALLVAEGLTRIAFPNQIQLWRVWRRPSAASKAMLGRTAGGYLWAFILLAYVTAFYAVMTLWFSWYTPASPSADPDMLATYLPFLGPLSMALHAGVLEEALFRALPLAGAVLLGKRFGHARLFLGLGLVAQALVFAGAHVSYPTEPVYARIVELFLPALAFGAVYLVFGLVPAILAHFAYDYVLMGLPIFTTQTSSFGAKAAFVAAGLVPLVIVLVARLRARRWTEVEPADRNALWRSDTRGPEPSEPRLAPPFGPRAWAGLVLLLSVGLAGWFGTTRTGADAPPVSINADEAKSAARGHLEAQGKKLKGFDVFASVNDEAGEDADYVMNEYGSATYRKLVGTYLNAPGWTVTFDGTGDQWYTVTLDHRGKVLEASQTVDELVSSSKLKEEQAVALGVAAVKEELGRTVTPEDVDFAEYWGEDDVDWHVTFKVPQPPLKAGMALVAVDIWGGQATDVYRYIEMPDGYYEESWDGESQIRLLSDVVDPVVWAFIGAMALYVLVATVRRRVSGRLFWTTGPAVFVASVVVSLNDWQTLTEDPFAEPGGFGVAGSVAGSVFMELVFAVGAGLVLAAAVGLRRHEPKQSMSRSWLLGIPVGAVVAGAVIPALRLFGDRTVRWPDYSALEYEVPLLGGLSSVVNTLSVGAAAALVFGLVNLLTGCWTRNRLRGGLLLAAGAAMLVSWEPEVTGFAALGLSAALASAAAVTSYVLVFRRNLAAVFPAAATTIVLTEIAGAAAPAFPGSQAAVLAGCAGALVVAGLWSMLFSRPLPENFGRRRSRVDFNTYWRRVVWAKPFAAGLPVLDERLLGQLRSITRTSRRARSTPCRLVLKDGSVRERVFLVEASRFLTAWGAFPDVGDPRFLDAADIERIEPSPFSLPAWIGRKVHRGAKVVNGQRYFRLKLRDGRKLSCSTPTLADFVDLPEGVSVDDVVSVKKERRPKDIENRLPQAAHEWCVYRDPARLYPGQEPITGFVILPAPALGPPAA